MTQNYCSRLSDYCPGLCYHPSGMYADPFTLNHYVQCGSTSHNSTNCQCCSQHHMRCPGGTVFDITTKQCVLQSKLPSRRLLRLEGHGYRYGYFWNIWRNVTVILSGLHYCVNMENRNTCKFIGFAVTMFPGSQTLIFYTTKNKRLCQKH